MTCLHSNKVARLNATLPPLNSISTKKDPRQANLDVTCRIIIAAYQSI